jgi:hypothetical protein
MTLAEMRRLVEWLEAEVAALHGTEPPDVGLDVGWCWEWGENPSYRGPRYEWYLRDADGNGVASLNVGDTRDWEDWSLLGRPSRERAKSLTEAMRAVAVHYQAVVTVEEIAVERARHESIRELDCNCRTCGEPCERCVLLTEDEVDALQNANLTQALDDKRERLDELEAAPWVRPINPNANKRNRS